MDSLSSLAELPCARILYFLNEKDIKSCCLISRSWYKRVVSYYFCEQSILMNELSKVFANGLLNTNRSQLMQNFHGKNIPTSMQEVQDRVTILLENFAFELKNINIPTNLNCKNIKISRNISLIQNYKDLQNAFSQQNKTLLGDIFFKIITKLLEQKEKEEVYYILKKIPKKKLAYNSIQEIAQKLSEQGHFDLAVSLINTHISSKKIRANTLLQSIQKLSKVGKIDFIIKTIRSISYKKIRDSSFCALIRVFLNTKQRDEAYKITFFINNKEKRALALGNIVVNFFESSWCKEEIEFVLKVAKTIPVQKIRIYVLTIINNGLLIYNHSSPRVI